MGRPKQPDITREQRIEKLMANMEPCPTTGCWIWTGKLNEQGYGRVCHSRKVHYAHRESYTLFRKEPTAEALDHTCNLRCCINPLHIEECTRSENMKRSPSRVTLCRKRLHLMTPDNVWTLKSGPRAGARSCRQCMAARNKAHRTPEKARKYNTRDRANNREKRLRYDRERYAKRKAAARGVEPEQP